MKKYFASIAILALALAAIVPALASENSCRVKMLYAGVLKGTPIAAGQYEVSWQDQSQGVTVTVAQKKNVVATVHGTLQTRDTKYPTCMVLYSHRPDGSMVIDEIRLGGTNSAIVFAD